MRHLIPLLLISAITISAVAGINRSNQEPVEVYVPQDLGSLVDYKGQALDILQKKCNVCHKYRNPSRVFTSGNMSSYADDIHTQVFVLERMPKGKRIKLSQVELNNLQNWINSEKSK